MKKKNAKKDEDEDDDVTKYKRFLVKAEIEVVNTKWDDSTPTRDWLEDVIHAWCEDNEYGCITIKKCKTEKLKDYTSKN